MRMLSVIILSAFVHIAIAQKSRGEKYELLSVKQGWNEGSIMLSDGAELKGLVKYNDREGVLSYHDGENTRPFTSKNVRGFEFFDEALQHQRVFYTFRYEDSQTSIKRPLFFEVIKEYKSFAILLRADPIEIYRETYGSPYSYGSTVYSRTEVSQVETIFIMDTDGAIKPYIEVTTRDHGYGSQNKGTKSKVLEEDLLSEYITKPVYEQLEKYAQENKLKFKRKDDFIKILEYYDTIEKK